MKQSHLDELLLRISKKDVIVKCEPFDFRIGWKNSFRDFPPNKKSPNQHWGVSSSVSTFIQNHTKKLPAYFNQSQFSDAVNNEDTFKKLSKVVLPELIEMPINKILPVDTKKSKVGGVFEKSSNIFWNIDYELVSVKYTCISVSVGNGNTYLFYKDDGELKKIIWQSRFKIYL